MATRARAAVSTYGKRRFTVDRIGGFLAEAGIYTLIGFCAIGAGLCLLAIYWVTKDDYRPVRVRPESDRDAKPWMLDSGGQPIVKKAKHRYEGAPDEGTRLLMPVTNTARSRVVMIGEEGLERGDYPGTTRRIRQPQEEDVQEESREDSERREDEGRPLQDGEEGGTDEEAPGKVRAFRNDVTGEIIMLDEFNRRIEFES